VSRPRARCSWSCLTLAPLALPVSQAAAPAVDAGALAHCAGITAADERLACYDSLARPKPSAARGATAPANAKVATGGASAAAPTAAAAATPDEKSFGLGNHPPPVEEGTDHIEAKVTGLRTDHLGNVRVLLDNNQVWTFTASDTLLRVGDAVTIKRGALGSFLLTTPNRHTYRAVRMQ